MLRPCYNSTDWRGDRVDDGAALEKRWAISLVGSNPTLSAVLFWRGAGVDYQARLESACRLGDRGFESHPLRQKISLQIIIALILNEIS